MHRVGAAVLEQLLNADHGGHCGQRVDCGNGHQAEFISYRTKHLQTILGEVPVRRAYYHCVECRDEGGTGVIPKDRDLDVIGTSFSPGMRRLMARVGAQEPFDAGRQDLAELAGVRVPAKAVERIARPDPCRPGDRRAGGSPGTPGSLGQRARRQSQDPGGQAGMRVHSDELRRGGLAHP